MLEAEPFHVQSSKQDFHVLSVHVHLWVNMPAVLTCALAYAPTQICHHSADVLLQSRYRVHSTFIKKEIVEGNNRYGKEDETGANPDVLSEY